jgi:hypothetical protein
MSSERVFRRENRGFNRARELQVFNESDFVPKRSQQQNIEENEVRSEAALPLESTAPSNSLSDDEEDHDTMPSFSNNEEAEDDSQSTVVADEIKTRTRGIYFKILYVYNFVVIKSLINTC